MQDCSNPNCDLPAELWVNIFQHTLLGTPSHIGGNVEGPSPFRLSAVCQAWRELFLQNPTLWTSISIHFIMETLARQTEMLELWLIRTASAPVDLKFTFSSAFKARHSYYIDNPDFSSPEAINIIQVVSPHASHIRSFDSIFSIYWQSHLEATGVTFPILSRLAIREYPEEDTIILNQSDYSKLDLGPSAFPMLSEVEIEGPLEQIGIKLPWDQLTTLGTRGRLAVSNVHALKPRMRQASFLCISQSDFGYYSPLLPTTPLPGTQRTRNLERLSLSGDASGPFGTIELLAKLGRVPLKSLHIQAFHEPDGGGHWTRWSYSQRYTHLLLEVVPVYRYSLRELSLVDALFEAEPLGDLLSHLPELVKLRLVSSVLDPIVEPGGLMLRLESGELLPQLETLDISGVLTLSDHELLAFFVSRCGSTKRLSVGCLKEDSGKGVDSGPTIGKIRDVQIRYRNPRETLSEELLSGCMNLTRRGIGISLLVGEVKYI